MKFTGHDYQSFTIQKIIDEPRLILMIEMGLGKTVCTLSAIQELQYDRFEIGRVLVIAPLRVADITWEEEINKWDHLHDLRLAKVLGSEKQRIQALRSRADLYVINRENTAWLIDYYLKTKEPWPFDMIVVDESSSFKNSKSQRFRALRKVSAIAKRIVLLTGTPAPNGLMDLWPQLYLVDGGKRLERTITMYRNKYFDPGARNRTVIFNYYPKPGAKEQIYQKIKDVSVSLKAQDHLKMPERVDNTIKLRMSANVRKIYETMARDYLVQFDEEQITAASASVVSNKLLQMANGAVYDENRKVVQLHDLKLEALAEIIETNEGKPILVLYHYQHDLERLSSYFKDLKPRQLQTREDKDDWDQGNNPLLLAHPASMGHGLNLQAGGNIIVWFGLTYSLEEYLQANARLYRQGQKETVIIHHLVVEGTRDEDAIKRLQAKQINQAELTESVKALIRKYKRG